MPPLSPAAVKAAMLDKLRSSCLTEKHATKLQIAPMTEDQAARLGVTPAWAGFKLTYFHPDGKPMKDFYRYRFWPESKPSKGWGAVTEQSKLRYVQPKNSELHIYLPPLLPTPWKVVMEDEVVDNKPPFSLCITEGELKAACACAHNIVTLGLGGVFSWMSKKHQQALIPELEAFNWARRPVYLCFDSDMHTKPLVQLAASRLAATLTAKGAVVHNVALPSGPDNSKLGMDDYIALYGAPSLQTLINTTHPLNSSADLHRLNEEVAFIWEGGAAGNIVRLEDAQMMTPDKFTRAFYRNRAYLQFNPDLTVKPKVVHAADEWLAWPYRFNVREITYDPGASRITPEGHYNIYRPGKVKPVKGDLSLWNELVDRTLEGAEPDEVLWLKRWMAYPLLHPGTKMHSCVLIWSARGGAGKNLLSDCLIPLYGAWNTQEITSKELSSAFNGWAEGRQLIIGNEITLDDKSHASGILKDMVTGSTTQINKKGINTYTVPNIANFYFTSNNPVAIILDEDERRTFVHRAPNGCISEELGARIGRHIVGDVRHKDGGPGAPALLHYFLRELDMGQFDQHTRPPWTEAKAEQVAGSRTELEDWAKALKDDPDRIIYPPIGPRAAAAFTGGGKPRYTIYTPAELLTLYENGNQSNRHATSVQLGRALDYAGFKKAKYNNAKGPRNTRNVFWIIRDDYKGTHLTSVEAARFYEQERKEPVTLEEYAAKSRKNGAAKRQVVQ